jgi:hypothetical protein
MLQTPLSSEVLHTQSYRSRATCFPPSMVDIRPFPRYERLAVNAPPRTFFQSTNPLK